MTTKNELIILILVFITGAAIGRYSSSAPDTKTATTSKIDDIKQADTDTKKTTTTITIKQPDGKQITKTVITQDTTKHVTENTENVTKQVSQVTNPRQTVNVSALVGVPVIGIPTAIYGVSVTKQLLGPITIGVWGLSNSTVGASVGLNF